MNDLLSKPYILNMSHRRTEESMDNQLNRVHLVNRVHLEESDHCYTGVCV